MTAKVTNGVNDVVATGGGSFLLNLMPLTRVSSTKQGDRHMERKFDPGRRNERYARCCEMAGWEEGVLN